MSVLHTPEPLSANEGIVAAEEQIRSAALRNARRERLERCREVEVTNSRRKGAKGEVELGHKLTEIFGRHCRRGRQFSGLEGKDVVGLPGVHIECKRVEKLNVRNAVKQAVRDAKKGEVPLVCHRSNGEEWLMTARLDDIISLCEAVYEIVETERLKEMLERRLS